MLLLICCLTFNVRFVLAGHILRHHSLLLFQCCRGLRTFWWRNDYADGTANVGSQIRVLDNLVGLSSALSEAGYAWVARVSAFEIIFIRGLAKV